MHLLHQALRGIPCFHRVLCFKEENMGTISQVLLAFLKSQMTYIAKANTQSLAFILPINSILSPLLKATPRPTCMRMDKMRHFAEAKRLWGVNLMKTQSQGPACDSVFTTTSSSTHQGSPEKSRTFLSVFSQLVQAVIQKPMSYLSPELCGDLPSCNMPKEKSDII